MAKLVPKSIPVPMPADWARLYSVLSNAWSERNDSSIPAPPLPLILAGAAFSSAADIRRRWANFVQWANDNGFGERLSALLPPPSNLDVAEKIAGVSVNGQGWWPEIGEQDHPPQKKPSPQETSYALEVLEKNWASIVGDEIAAITRPLRLRGHKRRRLVVAADPTKKPPWGGWWTARRNPRAFTNFRASVNEAIQPMAVDEVTFDTNRW